MRCWIEKNGSEVVETLGLGKLYENKVGALFVQCFFLFFYLSWNIAGEQFSFVYIFQLTVARITRD